MRRFASALVSLSVIAFAAVGCETTTDSSVLDGLSGVASTSLLVDPSEFLGDVPCANVSGAAQSYVAHIYDINDIKSPVALAAAPPVSCSAGVTFNQVVVGRQYRVLIDGYDKPVSQLVPLGSGSRTMLLKTEKGTGPVVAPRWQSSCEDITVIDSTRKIVDKCTPFTASMTTTGIKLDPRVAMKSAMPALACKTAGDVGDVHSWDVRPDNPNLDVPPSQPCSEDETAAQLFTSGIVPGQTYTFRLEAQAEAGGPVVWGTSCSALAKEGLVVDAVCDPFQADGAMEIVVDGLLGSETCTDPQKNVSTYDVSLGSLSANGVPCAKSVRFSPLAPGVHAAALVGYREAGDVAVEATCSAVVEPGRVTVATCTAL